MGAPSARDMYHGGHEQQIEQALHGIERLSDGLPLHAAIHHGQSGPQDSPGERQRGDQRGGGIRLVPDEHGRHQNGTGQHGTAQPDPAQHARWIEHFLYRSLGKGGRLTHEMDRLMIRTVQNARGAEYPTVLQIALL